MLGWDVGVVEVVVVEADFADGDAARVLREFFEFGEVFRGGLVGFLGVDAGCCEDFRVCIGEIQSYVHVRGTVADTDGEKLADAGGASVGEDCGDVFVVVEMTVRVDEHRGRM